jgi:CBS domain containing-hemolysin-like protein
MKRNLISLLKLKALAALVVVLGLLPASAQASMFKGDALDKMADVLTWVVLIVAPIVGIAVFLLVHILPEKIAEKKQHPQAKAIQCLCLLSLVFGGLLWPLAWLWAYSKPVLYRMAYGTDRVAHGHEDTAHSPPNKEEGGELLELRRRVAELETQLAAKSSAQGGKV